MSEDRLSQIAAAKAKAQQELNTLLAEERKLKEEKERPLAEITKFVGEVLSSHPFFLLYDPNYVSNKLVENIGIDEAQRLIQSARKISVEIHKAMKG